MYRLLLSGVLDELIIAVAERARSRGKMGVWHISLPSLAIPS